MSDTQSLDPRTARVVYVNSTLAAQIGSVANGEVSPIHHWGLHCRAGDALLCHRLNRYEVVLRSHLRGLDAGLLVSTLYSLAVGYRRMYLVSVPDLISALPLLKRLFPSLKIVTWAWLGRDVTAHLQQLRVCEHVFCLTEGALEEMHRVGLGHRASLELFGADPAYYGMGSRDEREFDVALLGQTLRDLALAANAAAQGGFAMATTQRVMQSLEPHLARSTPGTRPHVLRADNHGQVVELFRRSRVSWIPLQMGDMNPTGYTNLVESLLCGTPALIGNSSTIPAQVLTLPGVYRYQTGNVDDLVQRTHEALQATTTVGYRERVQASAAALLGGKPLSARLDELLQ
jgi:hypothetical protein